MSGLMVRIGAAVIAFAALSAGVVVGATPVVEIEIEEAAPAADFALAPSISSPAGDDGLPPPLANQTTTTVIPLPPGVVVGLVGLASAAIARRRYLKRR